MKQWFFVWKICLRFSLLPSLNSFPRFCPVCRPQPWGGEWKLPFSNHSYNYAVILLTISLHNSAELCIFSEMLTLFTNSTKATTGESQAFHPALTVAKSQKQHIQLFKESSVDGVAISEQTNSSLVCHWKLCIKPATQGMCLMTLTSYFLTPTWYTQYKIEERPRLE